VLIGGSLDSDFCDGDLPVINGDGATDTTSQCESVASIP
jgi:hypothetical protein